MRFSQLVKIAHKQWWVGYFVKVTELQLLGKKATKLQLPF